MSAREGGLEMFKRSSWGVMLTMSVDDEGMASQMVNDQECKSGRRGKEWIVSNGFVARLKARSFERTKRHD